MQCNYEPVPCLHRRPLKFLQPTSLSRLRVSVSLNCPYLKRENETGKPKQPPKQPPYQTIEINKPAIQKKKRKKKSNTISPFKPPFLSTAAGPPLQVEGYNTPTVSEAEFVSVHLSPPGSERQGASLPWDVFPTVNREDGMMPWPFGWMGGREGTPLVHGTGFKSL